MVELAKKFDLAGAVANAVPKVQMLYASKTGLDTPDASYRSENTKDILNFLWDEYSEKYFGKAVGFTQNTDDCNTWPAKKVIRRYDLYKLIILILLITIENEIKLVGYFFSIFKQKLD